MQTLVQEKLVISPKTGTEPWESDTFGPRRQVLCEPRVLRFTADAASVPFSWATPQLVRVEAVDDDENEDDGEGSPVAAV